MTFFFPFFLEVVSSASLVSNFLFKEKLGDDMTTPFDLVKGGGYLISVSEEEEELDSSIIWVIMSLLNCILIEDLNLSA